jgi:hypothetical protein
MTHIFVDESGCISFGPDDDKFFIFVMLSPKSGKELSKCIKNFNAHVIRKGWNPSVEIKASNVWHAPKNPDIPNAYAYKNDRETPMREVLARIGRLDLRIEYLVVKLDTVKASLRNVSNAILYNYFSWQLLKGPLSFWEDIELFIDKRSREYHHLFKFDGYIEGQAAICRAQKNRAKLNLTIHHYSSNSSDGLSGTERGRVDFGIRGIEAADFVCWAIRSKFENGDDQWFRLIEGKVRWTQHLYFTP